MSTGLEPARVSACWLSAVRPALSLHQAIPYVAGAYVVFLAIIVIYVSIMAVKQRRLSRQVAELGALVRRPPPEQGLEAAGPSEEMVERVDERPSRAAGLSPRSGA